VKKITIGFMLLFLSIILSCTSDNPSNDVVDPSIDLSNVYVAGIKNDQACYWHNNQLLMLDPGTLTQTVAKKIIVSNGDVYVFGGGFSSGVYKPLYWKNGVLTNLANQFSTYFYSISVTDMNVIGNDVYFVGFTYPIPFDNNGPSSLVYWKNNVKNIVTNYPDSIFTQSRIDVVNNNIYVLGAGNMNFPSTQGYYINGIYNELQDIDLYGIKVNKNNNDVYVFGAKYSANSSYYKNLTDNSEVLIPNTIDIDINFDENNNRFVRYSNKIFKNGALFFDGSAYINTQLYDFKFLNNNIYKMTFFGNNDTSPSHCSLNINATNVMQSVTGETYKSFFVVQN